MYPQVLNVLSIRYGAGTESTKKNSVKLEEFPKRLRASAQPSAEIFYHDCQQRF
jgi:hypothetical protein